MDSMDTTSSSVSASTSSGYQTSNTTSDSISDPIVIKEEVQDIEEYEEEEIKVETLVINLKTNKCFPQKRPRGRPPITDPKLKAINRKKSAIKATRKYLKKKNADKKLMINGSQEMVIKNNLLKTKLINTTIECQKLVILCNKFKDQIRAKDRKRLEKSEKIISNI